MGAALALFALAPWIAPPAAAAVLDSNWTEAPWLQTVNLITGMAWAPDGSGRLFLTRKTGEIRIVEMGPPPVLVETPFATVTPVFTNSECGVIGIAFDPEFLDNGYVYVFATVSDTEQQIIRYTSVGNLGFDKTTLIAGLPTRGNNHDGGAVGFGRGGRLFWAVGELGNGTGDDDDLSSLAAKVGRANPDGAIPPDNPFADGPGGNDDYIFARGFRNPFTFTFQPTTGTLWVDVAGSSYEQVFAVGIGDHAGWNDYENNQPSPDFIPPVIKYRTNGTDVRDIVAVDGAVRGGNVATFTTTATHGFRRGEKITVSGVTDPTFDGAFYVTSTPTTTTFKVSQVGPNTSSGGGTATTQALGGAITGGTFYDATAAPAAYQGNFFFGDFNSDRIMRAVVGPGITVKSVDYFATGNSNAVDVSVGPDGALYYVGLGGQIRRAAYNATSQDIVVSNTHVWLNEGSSAAFTVSLATAPQSDVAVTIVPAGGSTDVSVMNGAALTFSPSSYSVPQTVTLAAAADLDRDTDVTTFTVASTGIAPQTVEARVADVSGVSGGPTPGRVPDGVTVPGVPLALHKNGASPTDLDLVWSPSCGPTATDYSVHEGALGSWYSHNEILCTTAGATEATITPGAGDRYYLVVPLDDLSEGSYGTDSLGVERPRSDIRCRHERELTPCP
jgi:glucose/arabinose dehydrogenase